MPSSTIGIDNNLFPKSADGYDLFCSIGYGAFASVHMAAIKKGKLTGHNVAIKIIDLECSDGTTIDDIRKELQIMRMCKHINVLSYHTAFPAPDARVWVVMPLIDGGSCHSLLREKRKLGMGEGLPVSLCAHILHKVALALKHFHANEQMHRDLKAGNILLSSNGSVYLSDFGVSASLADRRACQTFVGTPCWMAPEVLQQNRSGYCYPADIWSFGILAIELTTGLAPYQSQHPLKVMRSILDNPPPSLEGMKLDERLIALVGDCLRKDPADRLAIEEILRIHAEFFSLGKREEIPELLTLVRPLDKREPTKPPGYRSPTKAAKLEKDGKCCPVSDSWDFKSENGLDHSPTDDDFSSLEEVENE